MFIDSQVLTLSSNEIRTIPKRLEPSKKYLVTSTWHPSKEVISSISADEQKKQTLFLFDIENLSYQTFNLPSEFFESYSNATKIIWNPNGDRMVLVTADGSLWQLDYPNLQNLEQLTPPMLKVKDISWSPDGIYISFVSDKDIYIVDTNVSP
jgi:WD40 repeat protein